MRHVTLAAAAAVFALSTAAFAHDYKIGDLVIDHPMAFNTAPTAKAGGGYLTITNTGDTADRLIGVRADFPKVELHTTEEKDGIARMMHVEAIEIPAGATVALEPGGLHVMFMGLDGDGFDVGEKIPATLIFETAGELEVEFSIEERGAAEEHDHSGHSVSN
ncbi:copper chaperone PCu(A)C [Roseobacter sinensis]|uniref:Copper chaperone PCu(A)C n=1 Tax=Roseobacter sinensis TaxID=2931391 RepID=A0ABT3BGM3_9RHOB|nr:copper chaperone PCu(A)C [Roseobacter sp. WL0113]MCV3272726.1 copper chaperone PCu(A)C [Roseobacter sp. WL0113]